MHLLKLIKIKIVDTAMSTNKIKAITLYVILKELSKMKEKIQEFVRNLMDSGMSIDEIINAVSKAAESEDFRRFVEENKNED